MKPESLRRLIDLRHQSEETGATMAELRGRFEELAGRHENGTAPRAVAAFNLFQTPADVAARMAAIVTAGVPDAGRVLEPSAGLGRIYRALRAALSDSCRVVMVEESADCCRELYRATEGREGDRLFQRDFLEVGAGDLGGEFDAACMNPPFKQGEDMRHIRHARGMLRQGGLLVSLCYDGARQNASLRPECDTWEQLPAGSFREAGTGAGVVLVTIRKR